MVRISPIAFKELKLISKRRSFLFLILFIPLFFGLVFSTYREAVPKDTPIGIVIDQKNLTGAQVREIVSIARTFSDPHLEDSLNVALNKLQREEYYIVIEISRYRDLKDAEYTVYYDNSMTPVASISENLLDTLQVKLKPAGIRAHPINNHASLPEFFFPGVLVILAILVGLELVPDTTIEERGSFFRIKLYSSLPMNFLVKILMGEFSILLQSLLMKVVYAYMNTKINLSWSAIGILLLTTLCFSLMGLIFVFLFKFEPASKSFLQITEGFLILMSGLLYPIGFFPKTLQNISRVMPSYYAGVMMRAIMLKSVNFSLFLDYLTYIGITTLVFGALVIHLYRRVEEWSTL